MRAASDAAELKAPDLSARAAGLRYICNESHGITRKKRGKTFKYIDVSGTEVTDEETLARIKRLAIPPAWTEVWICPNPDGHLQATGRDARGRKQYRYHPRWREVRDESKYARMIAFAKTLPKIRQRLAQDLGRPGLPREKILATVVKLLETGFIRVGNEEYARANKSYGLTTLQDKHVKVRGGAMRFEFRGKSGKDHQIDIHDPYLARIVKHCQDLPGQELFQYIDENGRQLDVTSTDVNEYLREVTGQEFTAKDFRTWAGTVLAAMALQEVEKATTQKAAKKNIIRAIESVAERLGNTPTICKKCYVHPAVVDAYLEGIVIQMARRNARLALKDEQLRPEEKAVLQLLERRLEAEKSKPSLLQQLEASLQHRQKGKGRVKERMQRQVAMAAPSRD
ncbi:MAG TPA: DNA topoisomerase IB [Methylomirabilota bacterium]|nr:DNA topoisomerase IB [Methylomirabilota bacterium]